MIICGLNHLHTTFSADGRLSIGEIAELAKKDGGKFLLITEHAEHITEEDYSDVVKACKSESSGNFIVVPGLEFMYDNYVHLLGLGLYTHPGHNPLQKQIIKIQELGGLAILAHANSCEHVPYDELRGLNGVEAWNSRYDGRFAPQNKGLEILANIREKEKRIIPCFGGLDFHNIREFRHLNLEVRLNDFSEEALVDSLKKGDFIIRNRWFKLGALERPGIIKRLVFRGVNTGYITIKTIKRWINPNNK